MVQARPGSSGRGWLVGVRAGNRAYRQGFCNERAAAADGITPASDRNSITEPACPCCVRAAQAMQPSQADAEQHAAERPAALSVERAVLSSSGDLDSRTIHLSIRRKGMDAPCCDPSSNKCGAPTEGTAHLLELGRAVSAWAESHSCAQASAGSGGGTLGAPTKGGSAAGNTALARHMSQVCAHHVS